MSFINIWVLINTEVIIVLKKCFAYQATKFMTYGDSTTAPHLGMIEIFHIH